MTQLLTDNLPLIVALAFLLIGYAMGRNSAERPILSRETPKEPKVEEFTPEELHDAEGGYIEDEVPSEEDYGGRIGTVK